MSGGAGMVALSQKRLVNHPLGHDGIMESLRQVAAHVQKGRLHEDVMSWAGHKLVEAGSPVGNLARASALFDAFAKQYAYMHDQRGVERIAQANLTLGNGKDKKPLLPGGDCDDAVVAYASACEAAGIPTAVVGAAYEGSDIGHVLLMVSDGNGKWVYADPSAKGYKFGQYKTPTREIILDTLTGEVLCDDTMCSPRMAGRVLDESKLPSQYLSLAAENDSGVPAFELAIPKAAPFGVLRAEGNVAQLTEDDRAYLRGLIRQADEALQGMRNWYRVAGEVAQALGQPLPGTDANPIFQAADLQRAVNLEAMLLLGMGAFEDVLAGKRTIGITEGLFGADIVVESLATDKFYVGFDLKKRLPELYERASNQAVNVPGQLGAFPVLGVAIAVAVISVAISGAAASDAWSKAKQAEAAAHAAAAQAEYELIKAGKDQELARVLEARRKITAEQNKGTIGGQVAEGAKGLGDMALKILAAVGGLLLIREGVRLSKG